MKLSSDLAAGMYPMPHRAMVCKQDVAGCQAYCKLLVESLQPLWVRYHSNEAHNRSSRIESTLTLTFFMPESEFDVGATDLVFVGRSAAHPKRENGSRKQGSGDPVAVVASPVRERGSGPCL